LSVLLGTEGLLLAGAGANIIFAQVLDVELSFQFPRY